MKSSTQTVVNPRRASFSAFRWQGGVAARFLAGVALAVLSAAPATAATLTYDADTTAPANDGAGVWNTTTTNWYDGTNDVLWPNTTADTAIFGVGGAGGTVTVGTVNAGTIQFNTVTTAYTLSGGTITLGTGITNNQTTLGATISSIIAGTNGLAFTGVAGNTTTTNLSGANTYTGVTTVNTGGRLALGNATGFGSNAGATVSALGTNYTQVNTGATVQVGASTAEAFLINGTGASTGGALRLQNGNNLSSFVQLGSDSLITGNFGTNTISGNVDLASHLLSIGNGSNGITLTVSGLVTNTGPITTSGFNIASGGALNLTNNANAYTGSTIVAGTLGLGGDTVLGSSTLGLGGTVQSTNTTARTIANALTVGTTVFGAAANNTGALNFTSTASTAVGNLAKTLTVNVPTAFAANLTGAAPLTITNANTGSLTLTGTGSLTGGVTLTAGNLNLGTGGTTGSVGNDAITLTAGTLAINRSNAVVQGTDFGALSSGAGSFLQAGTGTTTLNAANTYTGSTTVNAGTLAVNNTTGSGTGTGAVTIANGATLTGTGSAAGAVTDNGTINAGGVGAVGALSTGAETYNAGSGLVFDFGNDAIDSLTSTGLVSGLNNATITFTQLAGSTGLTQSSYTLLSAAGGFSSTTLPSSVTGTPNGYQLLFSGNNLQLMQIAPTPEPSQGVALLVGALGLGVLGLRARRRRA